MEMVKAYDGAVLVAALKAKGIEDGVKVGMDMVPILADWLRSSMKLSSEGLVGKLDDFAIPGVNYVEKFAMEKLAAIMAPAPAPVEPVAPAPEAVQPSV